MEKYETGALVGKGSFGSVVLATRRSDGAQLVIKRLPIQCITEREMEAYHNEIKLLSELEHPGIVTYIESFVDRAQMDLCIVMRHCNGGDLAQFIKARQGQNKGAGAKLSESEIKSHFVQMALALHYMHEKNILHRDLKAGNVFMRDGMVQLGDFGISKVLNGTADLASTCIGTPYYMSPELFKNKPYNHKSDVWALGCILYELTSLRHAFDAQNINGLASKVIGGVYPPIGASYSRDLRDLIKAMLGVTPSSRPSVKQILLQPPLFKSIRKYIRHVALGAAASASASASAAASGSGAGAGNDGASCDGSEGAGGSGDFRPAHVLNLRNQLDRLGPPLSTIFSEVEREKIEKRLSGKQHVHVPTPTHGAAAAAAGGGQLPRSRLNVNAPVAATAAAAAAAAGPDPCDENGVGGGVGGGDAEDPIERTLIAAPRAKHGAVVGSGDVGPEAYPGTIRRRRGRRAQSQSEIPTGSSFCGGGGGMEAAAATAAAASSPSGAFAAPAHAHAHGHGHGHGPASPRLMGRRGRRRSDDLQERLAALDREHALRLEELRAEEEARGKLQQDFERLQAAQAQRARRVQARRAALLGAGAGGGGAGVDEASFASTVTSGSSSAGSSSSGAAGANLPVISPSLGGGGAGVGGVSPLSPPLPFSASLSNLPALSHVAGAGAAAGTSAGAGAGAPGGGHMSSRESSRHASPALGPSRVSRAQHAAMVQNRMPHMLLGNGAVSIPSGVARSASPAPCPPGQHQHGGAGGGASSAGPSSATPSPRFNSRRLVAAAVASAATACASEDRESKDTSAFTSAPVVTVSSPRMLGLPSTAATAPDASTAPVAPSPHPSTSAEEQRHLNLKLLKRKAALRASPSFGAAPPLPPPAGALDSPSYGAAAPNGQVPPALEMAAASSPSAASASAAGGLPPPPPPAAPPVSSAIARGARAHGRREAQRITVPAPTSHSSSSAASAVGAGASSAAAAAAAGASPGPSASPLSPDSGVLSPSGIMLDTDDSGAGASERTELDRLRIERVRLEELLTRMDKLDNLDQKLFDGAGGPSSACSSGLEGEPQGSISAPPPYAPPQRRPSLPLHHHSPPPPGSGSSSGGGAPPHFATTSLPSAFDAPLLYKGRGGGGNNANANPHTFTHQGPGQGPVGQGQEQSQGPAHPKASRRHTAHNPGHSMDAAMGVGAGGLGLGFGGGLPSGVPMASTPTAASGGLVLAPRHRPYAHAYSSSPPPPSSSSQAYASSGGSGGAGGGGIGTRDRILAMKAAKKLDDAAAEQERLMAARKAYFHDRVRADQRTKEFYGNAPHPQQQPTQQPQQSYYPYPPPVSSRSPSQSPEVPEPPGAAAHTQQAHPYRGAAGPGDAQHAAARRLLALEEAELANSGLEVEQFQHHLAQYTRRIQTLRSQIEVAAPRSSPPPHPLPLAHAGAGGAEDAHARRGRARNDRPLQSTRKYSSDDSGAPDASGSDDDDGADSDSD